ncbi:hypothetical protein [Sphingomonas bacterium]|uniref:hypothetical protein n=1 Tax=Sphingomonas bacterium TaxID=1895847 RepID=UPI001575A09C|nr:hypothetical protein [Sphingomonas bacterium]
MTAPAARLNRRHWRVAALAAVLAGTVSCSNASDMSNDQRINDALLRTLTSKNAAICVDSGTYGEPLAIFRTMLVAPYPVRRMLHWSTPDPLRVGRSLSDRELVDDELREGHSMLPEAAQDRPLPLTAQGQLNALAQMASLVGSESGVRLHDTPAVPLAHVRWWPLNRLGSRCDAVHTVSAPVIKGDIAFLTVTAAHQGTIYAFHKVGTEWTTIAKWSNWLY